MTTDQVNARTEANALALAQEKALERANVYYLLESHRITEAEAAQALKEINERET